MRLTELVLYVICLISGCRGYIRNDQFEMFDENDVKSMLIEQSKEIEKMRQIAANQDRLLQQNTIDITALKSVVVKQEQRILKQAADIVFLKRAVPEQSELISRSLEEHHKNTKLDNRQTFKDNNDTGDARALTESKTSSSPKDNSKRLILMNQPTQMNTNIPRPAFTARLQNHITALGNMQAVVFDDVISNYGNGYSKYTGVFTSPVNGTFYFYTSILSHQTQYMETEIVLNGVSTVKTYSYDSSLYAQGSNAVVLALSAGDKVWVRHLAQEGQNIYGDSFSSFSGFQV